MAAGLALVEVVADTVQCYSSHCLASCWRVSSHRVSVVWVLVRLAWLIPRSPVPQYGNLDAITMIARYSGVAKEGRIMD